MSKAKVSDTKARLLVAAVKLVGKHGAVNVTRRMVAQAANPQVSDALVAHYFGNVAVAQKAWAAAAKKQGVAQPDKDKIEAIGTKLRAHGPRQPKPAAAARKRSVKEVKAIKTAVAKPKVTKVAKPKVTKVAKPKVTKVAKQITVGNSGIAKPKVVKVTAKKSVAAASSVKPSTAGKRKLTPKTPPTLAPVLPALAPVLPPLANSL